MAKSSFARPPAPGAAPTTATPAAPPRPPARPPVATAPVVAAPAVKPRTAPGATPVAPPRTAPRPAPAPVAAAPKPAPAVPPRRVAPAPAPAPEPEPEPEPIIEETVEYIEGEEEGEPIDGEAEIVGEEEAAPEPEPEPEPAPAAALVPAPRRRGRPPTAPQAAPIVTPPPAESQALAAIPRGAVGKITGAPIEVEDMLLPMFKLSQKVGPLSEMNPPVPPGTLVVGSGEQWEYLYADGSSPLGVTFVRTDKVYQQIKNEAGQKLYDLEENAMICRTPEEMAEQGGTCQDVLGMKVFGPMLACEIIIRMPEGLENDYGMFQPVEGHDGLFTRALWRISASAYREAGKKLLSEDRGFCANGTHTVEFNVATKYIPGKNPYYVPTLTNGAAHALEFVAYIEANA